VISIWCSEENSFHVRVGKTDINVHGIPDEGDSVHRFVPGDGLQGIPYKERKRR
jgi:hypothetical protein